MHDKTLYDVIVIGGGHAGTEACLAAARMGAKTALITHKKNSIGQMSCNPAIGGIGKSHLVREIDALGGIMACAADKAAIQVRTLNISKGYAVRATRAQADRELYQQAIQHAVCNAPNLDIIEDAVDDLLIDNQRVTAVVTANQQRLYAKTVVLCTGTFLGGCLHVGSQQQQGGRVGDPASTKLAQTLRALPFSVGRLKTGTPPRIYAHSVDYSVLQEQWGDSPTPMLSFMSQPTDLPQQTCCWITHTNQNTHDIIQNNLHSSAMYSGNIEGVGPRYCPSIEDKIVRFADKSSHQIFVEPEGHNSNLLYPNGISTSLDAETQQQMIHSITGFEQAEIAQMGYAIEYDFFNPIELHATLETKHIQGLYFAGQINGTTGYEEAAAQGLVAAINAVLALREQPAWVPTRQQAYIGVMLDDLITSGVTEPYRMFTSRAEYRLLLREDNADTRLCEMGRKLGLIDDARWQRFQQKTDFVKQESRRLQQTHIQPDSKTAQQISLRLPTPLKKTYSLFELLKRPELNYAYIVQCCQPSECAPDMNGVFDQEAALQVEINTKYAGYIDRIEQEIQRYKANENTSIPTGIDYAQVTGLSNEALQKLSQIRPGTIGQASRISGITPATVSLLLVFLKKNSHLRQTMVAP